MSSDLFSVTNIPVPDFSAGNYHTGLDCLLNLMARHGLELYQSAQENPLAGPEGLIAPDDVVLLKVNAQWKYRGCTNSDVVRGLIQRILEHPDGFRGEVIIFDNGQGQGSMDGDARGWGRYSDSSVQANAEDPTHSFSYLASSVFARRGVSTTLLDDVREVFIAETDHQTDGYRIWEGVSYPCFTTAGGNRDRLPEELLRGLVHGEPSTRLSLWGGWPGLGRDDRPGASAGAQHTRLHLGLSAPPLWLSRVQHLAAEQAAGQRRPGGSRLLGQQVHLLPRQRGPQ